MIDVPEDDTPSWKDAADLLPLVASQAPSLVLFRFVHRSGKDRAEFSPAVERLTGYAPDDFRSDPELFLRLIRDEDRPAAEELLSSEGEARRTRVLGLERRDGETVSVVVQTVSELTDEEGVRIHGAMRDVSGWSLEAGMPPDLGPILNALDEAVLFVDPDRRIRFFNRGAEKLFGWDAEEVLGENAGELLWHERDAELGEAFGGRALSGESFTTEIPIRKQDGERAWVWVSVNPVRDAAGEFQGVLGISRDVTAERIRRRVREQERERLNELLSSSPAVIFIAVPDPEEGFPTRSITENIRELTGHPPEAFTERREFWADHIHPDDRDRVIEETSRVLEAGSRVTEYRFRCADGDYRWLRDEVRVLEHSGDRPTELVGSVIDITERKEAEEELAQVADHLARTANELDESRRRYREAQEIGSIGSFVREVESGRVETSRQFLRIFGFEEGEEPEGFEDVFERLHPADREHALELKARLEEEGREVRTEFRVQGPEGERWIAARSRPETDEDGRVVRVRGTVQDVTDRKEAELELERFFTVSLDLLCIAGPEGRFHRVNPAFTEILGWSRDELLERPFVEFVHPDDREATAEKTRRLFEGGSVDSFENRYRTADGDYRWLLWKAVPDPSREQIYAAARDITERRRAEEEARRARARLEDAVRERTAELRASEREHRKIVENAPLGIARTTADGRILMANAVFARILGYDDVETAVERVDLTEDVYADPDDRERLLEILDEKGELRDEEVRWRTREGQIVWVRLDAIVEPEADGGGSTFLSFIQDITAERALEEQLHQSQKMEAVGTLAGGVAHDFNNLLTPILTNAELALEELQPGDPVREDLEDIRSAARKAAELTRQILSFSRKDDIEARVVDVAGVVTGMERMLNRTLPDHIRTDLHVPDAPCRTRADPNQLEQVVMNLAVNARDAMPDGGRLTLELRPIDLDREYTDMHADVEPGPYVLLEVSDTGVGMDAETRSRIFDPFFTTKEVGEGTGLGLSTVYSIVQRCGGQIGVYSEPGEGTVFRIYLPRVDADGETVEAGSGAEGADARIEGVKGAAATLLLAEDDDRVRRAAVRVLRASGYEVVEAADGAEALTLFEELGDEVDLLVTDVIMPKMDGGALAERCAELRPDLPVLFMSGYTERSLHERSGLGEEIAFLQKPFTPSELEGEIRRILGD